MKFSYYTFEYDYDVNYACRNGSDCCDNDFCRCGVIVNEQVTQVPSEYLIEEFKKSIDKKKKWTDFENYCLGRLFTSHKLYDPEKYYLNTCSGYYGEEIYDISCDYWLEFEKEAQEMLLLEDDNKIRYVLKKEYKYLLDGLENVTFEVKSVKYDDILPPDDYRRLEGQSLTFNAPIGIYKPIGERYRIIDGHHRWASNEGTETVKIIVANLPSIEAA